jgi:hypothetical protein
MAANKSRSKLNRIKVVLIRRMAEAGKTYREIGEYFNIGRSHACRVASRRIWKNIQ